MTIKKEKKERYQYSLKPSIVKRGEVLADKMGRSFSNMLEVLITEECDRRGIDIAAPSFIAAGNSPKLTQKELSIAQGTIPSLKPRRGSRKASRDKR